MPQRVTDTYIRALPIPPAGQITYNDDNSPLKIRVSKGGSKTFIVMLGSGRRHTIGRYGEVSLADAREAARRLRAQKTLGTILPSTETVENARKQYLSAIKVRPSTKAYYTRHLDRLSGKLGHYTPTNLSAILDRMTPAARNQALATFKAFFSWCVERRYLTANPCQHISLTKQKSRERVLTDAELKAIWEACEDDSFSQIVRMLMLTGQRRNEIAALESGWVNETAPAEAASRSHRQTNGVTTDECSYSITFPPHITKNGEEHSIPLAHNAQSLLAEAMSVTTCSSHSTLLLPSDRTGGRVSGWNKLKAAFDKRCQIAPWTLHDLRRTFATIHARIGTPPHITERLLNHKTSSTLTPIAKVYNKHQYFNEMRAAMEAYDAYISRLISATDAS